MGKLWFLSVLFSTSVLAQTKIIVSETQATMNGVERTCLSVSVKGVDALELKKEWKTALNKLKGMVVDETVIHAHDCTQKAFGQTHFDLYSIIESSIDTSAKLMAAFYVNGNNITSGSEPELYLAANEFVRAFAVSVSKTMVKRELENRKAELKTMESSLKSVDKERSKLAKDVTKLEAKVKANNESINGNISSQKAKQSEIHRLEMDQIEHPSAEIAKVIKGYEKELEGMKKDKVGLEKDNEKLAEKIKESKADIEQNLKDQDAKKAEIAAMKKVIAALGAKLDAIN